MELAFTLVCSVLALVFAVYLTKWVLRNDEGIPNWEYAFGGQSSASLSGGVLTIIGSGGADAIKVISSGGIVTVSGPAGTSTSAGAASTGAATAAGAACLAAGLCGAALLADAACAAAALATNCGAGRTSFSGGMNGISS